ncbi:uncharacterized protein PAC_16455 [Phialocephala subalpina]|uniref:FAD/NAD(P)-binding domain-containing protein n=1 Tax=Phialocephala subalpina TaxID=576137 RepID=A0A1L7XNG6_9HELO|nr:uncharacterized protein PAC_16455 [Phialocephala subalpina]
MSQPRRHNASLAPHRPHILVIGGAYGGLSTIVNLLNLSIGNKQLASPIQPPELNIKHDPQPVITLLDERDGLFHTMGSPLAHLSPTFAHEAWLPFSQLKLLSRGGVNILQGRALHINMSSNVAFYLDAKSGSQRQIAYDYLVVATGTKREFPIVPSALGKKLLSRGGVNILQGRALHINMSSNVAFYLDAKSGSQRQIAYDYLVVATGTKREFPIVPSALGKKVYLEDVGVFVAELERWDSISVTLSDGEEIVCGKAIYTTFKHQARTKFLPRDVVDENGFVKVRNTLQFAHPHHSSLSHFAIGDIAAWTGIKRAGNAFIMGQFTATNILKLILHAESQPQPNSPREGKEGEVELVCCPDMEPMMALNIGDNVVVYQFGRRVQWGEELKERVVGRGLGIDVCSEYLCLKDAACFL